MMQGLRDTWPASCSTEYSITAVLCAGLRMQGRLKDIVSLLRLTGGPQLRRCLSTLESSTPVQAGGISRESYLADIRRSFMQALHRNDAAQALELRKIMELSAHRRY